MKLAPPDEAPAAKQAAAPGGQTTAVARTDEQANARAAAEAPDELPAAPAAEVER